MFIAVKKSFRPLILHPHNNVEEVSVKLQLPNQFNVLIGGVYLPPSASVKVYEFYAIM